MENMINKVFLESILNIKIVDFKYIKDNDRKFRKEVFLIVDDEGVYDLSPEELGCICKKWAFYKGYDLATCNGVLRVYPANGFGMFDNEIKFLSLTLEVESIFEACQWILKEIKK